MADNTLQYEWIVTIKGNLDGLLPDFVAGDLLWYPVEGEPRICVAPDVLVALGRPKGHRRSYKQWEEQDQAPQVVFEVQSHSNTFREMLAKLKFYGDHGVQEFYLLDPDNEVVTGFLRQGGDALEDAGDMEGFVSPLLGLRFGHEEGELVLRGPGGQRFLSFSELQEQAKMAEERAGVAEQRARALAEKLRALGIDPDE